MPPPPPQPPLPTSHPASPPPVANVLTDEWPAVLGVAAGLVACLALILVRRHRRKGITTKPELVAGELSEWVTCAAEDGTPYFFHPASGTTTWELPKAVGKAQRVQMPHRPSATAFPGTAMLQILRHNRTLGQAARHAASRAPEDVAMRDAVYVHPEKYLQASFEVFLLMLALAWLVTSQYNHGVIERNRIRDIFSYNNVCVGFDTAPARFVAQPLFAMQAYLGIRFATLDSLRAELQRGEGSIGTCAYWMTVGINTAYALTMLTWGMLLIVTPDVSLNHHFYIYVLFVVVMYLTILANFIEAPRGAVSTLSAAWCALFGLWTALLLLVGSVGFNGYDYALCPSDNVTQLTAAGLHEQLCKQTPAVPVALMASLDYGWFVLLLFATPLLPASPPLVMPVSLYVHGVHPRPSADGAGSSTAPAVAGATKPASAASPQAAWGGGPSKLAMLKAVPQLGPNKLPLGIVGVGGASVRA